MRARISNASHAERKYAWATLPVIGITLVLFWACYETIATRMYSVVDEFAGSPAQALNPATLIILLPLVIVALFFLNRGKMKLHYLHMIAIAIFTGIGSILLFEFNQENFNWPLLISHTVLITLAEVSISPFLLSYVTRISGKKLACLAIAGLTAMFSLANYLGAFLSKGPDGVVFVALFLLLLIAVAALLIKQLAIRKKGF